MIHSSGSSVYVESVGFAIPKCGICNIGVWYFQHSFALRKASCRSKMIFMALGTIFWLVVTCGERLVVVVLWLFE